MRMLQLSQCLLGLVDDVLRGLASLPGLDKHRSLAMRFIPGLPERRLCPRGAIPGSCSVATGM